MAMKKNTGKGDGGTTRRGFIGALGAVAVTSALPPPALAAPGALSGPETLAKWREKGIPSLRAAYVAELVAFAETLRPQFESGALRGMTDEDLEDGQHGATSPLFRLEDLCEAHFGLNVGRNGEAAYLNAYLIRAVSPSDGDTEDAQPIAGQAVLAVARDVIVLARARRWYTPAPDECPSVESTAAAREVLS